MHDEWLQKVNQDSAQQSMTSDSPMSCLQHDDAVYLTRAPVASESSAHLVALLTPLEVIYTSILPISFVGLSIYSSKMHPHSFYILPNKKRLLDEYKDKKVNELPTPSLLIDKVKFTNNAIRMLETAKDLNVDFRVHIKTLKAAEAVRIQLTGDGLYHSDKIVVSTLPEAWIILPLIDDGTIKDVLLGIPIAKLMLPEVARFLKLVPLFKLMVDDEAQIEALETYAIEHGASWEVFVKVDMGTHRAGLEQGSSRLHSLILKIVLSKSVKLHGFYCHAGHSYGARSDSDAHTLLMEEIRHANVAAKHALSLNPELKLQVSVGATPTAHVSQQVKSVQAIEDVIGEKLVAKLELHAGNYTCCDLQQAATNLVGIDDVSIFLLAEILSEYPDRGPKGPGEQLINAGGIAFSKDTGPTPGYGQIVRPPEHKGWYVARVSQEHGVLQPKADNLKFIPYGTKIQVVPQHACMTASNHAWYYIIEDGVVADIWVPAKLW